MATDGQVVLAAARWSEEAIYLKDLHKFPALVKIIKGQYGALGVPSLGSPALQSTAVLVTTGRRSKILAQGVKLKEGRKGTGVGPTLSIPETYPGYFEILSEEGRAGRCIESVGELARRKPEGGCLVREPVRGMLAVGGESSRIVPAGQLVYPGGEVSLPGRGKFLSVRDSRGEELLLGFETRGKFSPVARGGGESVSGVHTAKGLLGKRLPLTVRLVSGPPPPSIVGGRRRRWPPDLRLLAAYKEEHLFAFPLGRGESTGAVLPLPGGARLKLVTPANAVRLEESPEYKRLVERASRLAGEASLFPSFFEGEPPSGSRRLRPLTPPPPVENDENGSPEDYEEIDRLYDYVRGLGPMPTRPPNPPPVDTIPGKKKEKRKGGLRREGGAFLKNDHRRAGGRVLRGTRPAEREPSPTRQRYKSLSELHNQGTLDSSQSGGGESGAKLPEKRSRRLPRPLSLTDLVWELGSHSRNAHKPKRIATLYL